MTLTERLNSIEGEHGDYAYRVDVWRSDTLAVANLRVLLTVYRKREHSFLFWNWTTNGNEVYRQSKPASDETLDTRIEWAVEKAESVVQRFEDERVEAEEVGSEQETTGWTPEDGAGYIPTEERRSDP